MNELEPREIDATPEIRAAIESLGRCEDVSFSPDGARLAIAAFGLGQVAVLDIGRTAEPTAPMPITGFTTISSAQFVKPHGVAFIGNRLMVADRETGVFAFDAPQPVLGVSAADAAPSFVLPTDAPVRIASAGSVRVAALDDGIFEVVVCSNYLQRLTRHFVDTQEMRSLCNEILLTGGHLHMPDGVAISNDRRWLAVASPQVSSVLIYDFAADFTPTTVPAARIPCGSNPHGLTFTHDDHWLLVADADLPNMHVLGCGSGWGGGDGPQQTIRVTDDATYALFSDTPGEGGPKGVAVHPDGRLVAVCAQTWPLRFYSLTQLTGTQLTGSDGTATPHSAHPPRRVLADTIARNARFADEIRWRQRAMADHVAALAERDRKLAVLEQLVERRLLGDQDPAATEA